MSKPVLIGFKIMYDFLKILFFSLKATFRFFPHEERGH